MGEKRRKWSTERVNLLYFTYIKFTDIDFTKNQDISCKDKKKQFVVLYLRNEREKF